MHAHGSNWVPSAFLTALAVVPMLALGSVDASAAGQVGIVHCSGWSQPWDASTIWRPSNIEAKYEALGGEGFLGKPLAEEVDVAGGPGPGDKTGSASGCYEDFEYGSIYWNHSTGAWEVHGAIRVKYRRLGAVKGVLGFPTTDGRPTSDGKGGYNDFQNGSIYWDGKPEGEAWEIDPPIRDKWRSLGAEKSALGPIIRDSTQTADGWRYNDFQKGSIYWDGKPGDQAWEIDQPIRDKWRSLAARLTEAL